MLQHFMVNKWARMSIGGVKIGKLDIRRVNTSVINKGLGAAKLGQVPGLYDDIYNFKHTDLLSVMPSSA